MYFRSFVLFCIYLICVILAHDTSLKLWNSHILLQIYAIKSNENNSKGYKLCLVKCQIKSNQMRTKQIKSNYGKIHEYKRVNLWVFSLHFLFWIFKAIILLCYCSSHPEYSHLVLFDNAFIFIYSVLLYIETRDFIMVPTTKPIREEFYAYVCLSWKM